MDFIFLFFTSKGRYHYLLQKCTKELELLSIQCFQESLNKLSRGLEISQSTKTEKNFLFYSDKFILDLCWRVMYAFHISDVISIEKTNENFRLLYDVKGRFTVHRIQKEEAKVIKNWQNEQHRKMISLILFSEPGRLS